MRPEQAGADIPTCHGSVGSIGLQLGALLLGNSALAAPMLLAVGSALAPFEDFSKEGRH
jgi:hypothetical protein